MRRGDGLEGKNEGRKEDRKQDREGRKEGQEVVSRVSCRRHRVSVVFISSASFFSCVCLVVTHAGAAVGRHEAR